MVSNKAMQVIKEADYGHHNLKPAAAKESANETHL